MDVPPSSGRIALFNLSNLKLYSGRIALLNLSNLKLYSVRNFISTWFDPETVSDSIWCRELRAWELEEVLKLNEAIVGVVLTDGSDQVVWSVTNKNPILVLMVEVFC